MSDNNFFDMKDDGGTHALFDNPQMTWDALRGADSLLWVYDLSHGRFEFQGDAAALDLPSLHGQLSLNEVALLFDKGETGRLEHQERLMHLGGVW